MNILPPQAIAEALSWLATDAFNALQLPALAVVLGGPGEDELLHQFEMQCRDIDRAVLQPNERRRRIRQIRQLDFIQREAVLVKQRVQHVGAHAQRIHIIAQRAEHSGRNHAGVCDRHSGARHKTAIYA